MKKLVLFAFIVLGSTILSSGYAQKKNNVKNLPSTVLTDWMELQCRMVRSAKGIAHVAYSRHFSYTALAAYESIVGSNRSYYSLSGQLNGLKQLPVAPEGTYWPASLNASYAAMLRQFYSSFGTCNNRIDSMESAQKQSFVSNGIKIDVIEKSAAYGKSVAVAIIDWLQTDGSTTTKVYTSLKVEGMWTPAPPSFTAAAPFWSETRSFSRDLNSVYNLTQPTYAANTSTLFYKMADEVYTVSQHLTPEQKAIALFWDDSPNGSYMTVYGHWTSILCNLLKKHQFSLGKSAEAYLKMALSMHDASILAWKGKYQYNVVRPITFIQQYIDKNWTPLISTPPHPEFPAAHATLSNAAATALCSVFGNACAVTDNSYVDIGMSERSFASLQDAAKEAGISRLYGGIHYRYSIEQGFDLGAKTAKHVLENFTFQLPSKKK